MTHTCTNCGIIYEAIPANARPWMDGGKLLGYFWECECKSTMFKKVSGE